MSAHSNRWLLVRPMLAPFSVGKTNPDDVGTSAFERAFKRIRSFFDPVVRAQLRWITPALTEASKSVQFVKFVVGYNGRLRPSDDWPILTHWTLRFNALLSLVIYPLGNSFPRLQVFAMIVKHDALQEGHFFGCNVKVFPAVKIWL